MSNDGIHLVVACLLWDKGISDRGNAIDSYAKGRRLASYNEEDLLTGYWPRLFACNLADSNRPRGTVANLDEASQVFEFGTNWGDAFAFDIRTGSVVDSRLPWAFRASLFGSVALAALLGCMMWRLGVRQRHKP